MKKILFSILFLFMSVLTVKANSTFYLGEKVSNMYIESIKGSEKHNGAPFLLHRSDGKLVYCLNPFKMMNTEKEYKSYNYNNSIFNLSDDSLNKLNIISYFGYGYKNHTDIKWYGITQYLIWKNLNMDDIYFTDSYYGSRVEMYQSEVKELERLVDNYYKLPSFANKTYKYYIKSENILYDSNNVLGEYEIKETSVDATIKDNTLSINPKKEGEYIIKFVKKSPITNQYILYGLNDSQSLLYPGKINDIEFILNIKVESGSVTVNINNEELKNNLKDKKMELYKDTWLYDVLTLDEFGRAYLDELTYGRYTLKPLKIEGYNTEYYEYVFYIDSQFLNQSFGITYKPIIGNLILNKYYGNENNYVLDNNAVFEIYKDDILIKTIKSKEGIINEPLEYGSYLIKQIEGEKYYSLSEEFKVEIIDNKNYQFDLYTELDDDFILKQENLNNKEKELKEKENELVNLENEFTKKIEELELKKLELTQFENILKQKTQEINNKVCDSNEKIIELNNLQDNNTNNPLIVDVPNTSLKNYNKIISNALIFLGFILILIYKKKTTND